MIDILFINPNSLKSSYQNLSNDVVSIEPPTWILLLAEGCRTKGNMVDVIDCVAENLENSEIIDRILYQEPRLICFVVYGPNPSSSISNMGGAIDLANNIKKCTNIPICFIGKYASAVPEQLLTYSCVDFVALNEGLYCLLDLLQTNLKDDLNKVRALGYKKDNRPILNSVINSIVPQDKMDIDYPGYAIDLLPYKNKPLDLYKTQIWHNNFQEKNRDFTFSLYTSLGCYHKCSFCTVNIIYKNNDNKHYNASNFSDMRFWSHNKMLEIFDKLTTLEVKHIRISDDSFSIKYHETAKLLSKLKLKDYVSQFNIWTYARIDAINKEFLELCNQNNIKWIAPGIESLEYSIRQNSNKGSYKNEDIFKKIALTKQYGVNVIGNYIFGLPNDTLSTMQTTLKLMLELQTEYMNCFPCIALPGSRLYLDSVKHDVQVPFKFSEFGFLSEDCIPMPTKYCTNKEVLEFRDKSWLTYMTNPNYLTYIKEKFGISAVHTLQKLVNIPIHRKLLMS